MLILVALPILYFAFLFAVALPLSKVFGALLVDKETGTYNWKVN